MYRLIELLQSKRKCRSLSVKCRVSVKIHSCNLYLLFGLLNNYHIFFWILSLRKLFLMSCIHSVTKFQTLSKMTLMIQKTMWYMLLKTSTKNQTWCEILYQNFRWNVGFPLITSNRIQYFKNWYCMPFLFESSEQK